MACEQVLPPFIQENYEVHEWRHACAILQNDFPNEWQDVIQVLTSFRLNHGYIVKSGGNKSFVSLRIDTDFGKLGWQEKRWDTTVKLVPKTRIAGKRKIDLPEPATERDSPTHNVDCFKNKVAIEIEWNNKDPFYDRDLNNFRLLFEMHAVSVGIIITRCDELQSIFNSLGRGKSYGMSTTHMSKLLPRLHGGGSGGCPVLVLGIRKSLYDPLAPIEQELLDLIRKRPAKVEDEDDG